MEGKFWRLNERLNVVLNIVVILNIFEKGKKEEREGGKVEEGNGPAH